MMHQGQIAAWTTFRVSRYVTLSGPSQPRNLVAALHNWSLALSTSFPHTFTFHLFYRPGVLNPFGVQGQLTGERLFQEPPHEAKPKRV